MPVTRFTLYRVEYGDQSGNQNDNSNCYEQKWPEQLIIKAFRFFFSPFFDLLFRFLAVLLLVFVFIFEVINVPVFQSTPPLGLVFSRLQFTASYSSFTATEFSTLTRNTEKRTIQNSLYQTLIISSSLALIIFCTFRHNSNTLLLCFEKTKHCIDNKIYQKR